MASDPSTSDEVEPPPVEFGECRLDPSVQRGHEEVTEVTVPIEAGHRYRIEWRNVKP